MHGSEIFSILIATTLAVASPEAVAESSPELVEAWAQDWQKRADKIVGRFNDRFEERLRHSLDSQAAELAIVEFRAFFNSAVNWDVFSKTVVDSIVSHCGNALLDKIEPHLIKQANLSGVDEALVRNYSVCYADAMGYAESAAVYAIAEKAGESGGVFFKYEAALSNYQRISSIVSTASVEQRYGGSLDEVISLHKISHRKDQRRRVTVLKSHFSNDPAVIHVSLEDPGYPYAVYGQAFHFYVDNKSPTRKSCSGASPPEQEGLIRCSWDAEGYTEDNVIKYTRRFEFEGEKLELIVEFDYEQLVKVLR